MIRNRLTFERSSLSFWGEGEPPNFAAFEVSQVVDERERGNEFFLQVPPTRPPRRSWEALASVLGSVRDEGVYHLGGVSEGRPDAEGAVAVATHLAV